MYQTNLEMLTARYIKQAKDSVEDAFTKQKGAQADLDKIEEYKRLINIAKNSEGNEGTIADIPLNALHNPVLTGVGATLGATHLNQLPQSHFTPDEIEKIRTNIKKLTADSASGRTLENILKNTGFGSRTTDLTNDVLKRISSPSEANAVFNSYRGKGSGLLNTLISKIPGLRDIGEAELNKKMGDILNIVKSKPLQGFVTPPSVQNLGKSLLEHGSKDFKSAPALPTLKGKVTGGIIGALLANSYAALRPHTVGNYKAKADSSNILNELKQKYPGI